MTTPGPAAEPPPAQAMRADPGMILAQVHASVSALAGRDAREVGARARLLADLDRLPRPFDEHADPTHVTASAIVTGSRGTVLHRHKRLGRWLQPGGHLAGGELPWEAAVRETLEETGLRAAHPGGQPRLVHVDVHPAPRGHTHLDLRYLLHAEGDPAPAPGESPAVAWFSWPDAIAVADDALIGALRACAPPQPSGRERE